MPTLIFGLLLSVLLVPVASAQEPPGIPAGAAEDWKSAGWQGNDFIVAEVTFVEKRLSTNGKPPRVKLKVIRVIHGRLGERLGGNRKIDRSNAAWLPRWPFGAGICGNDERIPGWLVAPFGEYP